MGKSTEPTFTGRNGAGRLLPSCFKRRSLGPAAVAQPSDTSTSTSTNTGTGINTAININIKTNTNTGTSTRTNSNTHNNTNTNISIVARHSRHTQSNVYPSCLHQINDNKRRRRRVRYCLPSQQACAITNVPIMLAQDQG